MAYATRERMIRMYGEAELIGLTDRLGMGVIDDAVLDTAIEAADATIDASLAGRYRLPLATVPDSVAHAACDIVRFSLYTDDPGDAITARWQSALRFLADLRDGKAVLLDSESKRYPAPNTGAGVAVMAGPFIYTDNLLGMPQ